jgi:UDP-N-acetylglucosamine--N-acetylmuramyl-(pentapeptide) pyrophosphoryl-undecaprenol N-acetylglucosamine transferase
MKIVFTGGGTGGHFYPIIAIAQKVNQIIDRENIVGAKLYYFSDSPYDKQALFENGLLYEQVNAGKMRIYFSLKNISDMVKVFFGTLSALVKLFSIYPDVVFGKGGRCSRMTGATSRATYESRSEQLAPARQERGAGENQPIAQAIMK